MKKSEFVALVAEKTGLSKKDTEKALNAALETITAALATGDRVQLVGFGTFETKDREARTGRNPSTGEPMEIPAARLPVFKAGKALKDTVAL
mgnify:CR=1 FL=1